MMTPEHKRRIVRDELWRLRVDRYAEKVSDGKWKRYNWIVRVLRLLQDLIEEGNARVILNVPPRHGKSEGVSHWFPTWFIDTFPELSVILGSYGQDLASSFGRKVRDHFYNVGEDSLTWSRVRRDKYLAKDWMTYEGGGMKSVGVGSAVTGRGGNVILVDDPHKDWAEAMSEQHRQRVIDWFNGTLYTRLEPGGSIIVIQTRWHERDLTGYLLEEHADEWLHICLPAIAEEDDMLGREPGEALCPERYDIEALLKMKAANEHVFNGLYQQRPAMAEGELVKRDWLRYYRQSDIPDKAGFDRIIHSWDLTFKGAKTSDYVCGTVWGTIGSKRYLLDWERDKMDYPAQLRAVLRMYLKWGGNAVYLEDAANGQALKHSIDGEVSGVVLVPARGSKEERLFAVMPTWQAGDVYLPDPSERPEVKELIEELVSFPKAPNDDFVDSSTMALRKLMVRSAAATEINIGRSELRRPSPWRSY